MKQKIIIITSVIFIASLLVMILFRLIPIPVSLRHIGHLAFPPEDLYNPIVTDNFSFHEKGFSKVFSLRPKYLDIYEVGIVSSEDDIPSSYKFSGKIKFDFFHNDKHLFEKISLFNPSVFYSKNDNTKIHAISLITFELPLMGKYKDNLSVKVTVVEEDDFLKSYIDSTKLYIAVSSIP